MANNLKLMGDVLPVEDWHVAVRKDGSAEVCVTQLDGIRYWYTVRNVQVEGKDFASVTVNA